MNTNSPTLLFCLSHDWDSRRCTKERDGEKLEEVNEATDLIYKLGPIIPALLLWASSTSAQSLCEEVMNHSTSLMGFL